MKQYSQYIAIALGVILILWGAFAKEMKKLPKWSLIIGGAALTVWGAYQWYQISNAPKGGALDTTGANTPDTAASNTPNNQQANTNPSNLPATN